MLVAMRKPWTLLRLDWLLTPDSLLQLVILWPLELYEAVAILPVSFLRRHVPVLGGALVVLMTLHGILLRLFLELLRAIFARVTYSRDPVLTFRSFWRAMQDHYAFLEPRRVDWQLVRQLFGDAIQPATSDDDLWIALQESVSLCDDPSLTVSRVAAGPRTLTVRGQKLPTVAALKFQRQTLAALEREHLTQGGRRIANGRFVCGILNAETSPGWRIGYICLTAMQGFVEFPLPRVDALMPSWTRGSPSVGLGVSAGQTLLEVNGKAGESRAGTLVGSSVAVPEIYDLESMRWSLEAILLGLGDIDGLILDLRFNQGGGSHVAALTIASFFASESKALAFSTDEKLPGATPRFSKRKKYYMPYTSRCTRYRGPLAILQSQYTRGTAELLCLSLMKRPLTCRVGATTAGSLSPTRQLRLPNYWTVEIPYQRIFSANNELFEGVGIPPTKTVPDMEVFPGQMANGDSPKKQRTTAAASSAAFDPCVRKAIDHIMDVETTVDK